MSGTLGGVGALRAERRLGADRRVKDDDVADGRMVGEPEDEDPLADVGASAPSSSLGMR